MHILHLTIPFEYACGVSRHVWCMAREQRREHRVTVATSHGAALGLLRGDDIEILQLPSWGNRMAPWQILRSLGVLYAFVHRERVSVLHAHHRYLAVLGRMISSVTNVPVVATCHAMQPRFSRLTYPVGRVIAVSETTRQYLRDEHDIPDERIVVVPHAVPIFPPPSGPPDPSISALDGRPLVVAAGRLSADKGLDTFIDALAMLRARSPAPIGVVIGNGPLRDQLERRVRDLKAPVIFTGVVPSVQAYFQRAAVVVQPSRRETASLTILEAGALGRPVVVTDVGGLAEVVTAGETGLVVPPDDPARLASAIARLLDDPALGLRVGTALRESLLPRLDPRPMVEATARVYAAVGAR